jgi:hypothetical protein
MKMIQEWLGHSVFQTTANSYSHLAVDAKNIVADSIAEKLLINETKSMFIGVDAQVLDTQSAEKPITTAQNDIISNKVLDNSGKTGGEHPVAI